MIIERRREESSMISIYRSYVSSEQALGGWNSAPSSSFFFLEDDRKRNCRAGQGAAARQRTQPRYRPRSPKYLFVRVADIIINTMYRFLRRQGKIMN